MPTPNASPRSAPDPRSASIGDSYDNSLAETVNGLYKTELIRRQGPWRNVDHVELATLAWVDWFNNRRLHSELGDVPPAEFEHDYYARPRADTPGPNTHPDLMQTTGRFNTDVSSGSQATSHVA